MKRLKALFSHKGTGHGGVTLLTTGALNDSLEDKIGYDLSDECYKDEPTKSSLISDYNANIGEKEPIEKCKETFPVPPAELLLLPCAVCGRTFQPESLSKHVTICQKTANKKRKTFDSSRQRREGTDLAQYLPKNFGLPENSPFAEKEKSVGTPKMPVKKHSPRANGGASKVFSTPEHSRCPHCGRGFGARAFDRHVAWCAERTRLAIAPGASSGPTEVRVARSRLMARTSYRAPPVKTRRSLTREKYSLSRSASVDSAVSDRSSNAEESRRLTLDGNSQHLPIIMKTSKNNDKESLMTRSLTKPRFDDNYDPFLSAKRQMMDLMSSSTNLNRFDSSSLENNKKYSPPVHVAPSSNTLTHSPHFQRSRSLRVPSNKYNYTGRLVNTKIPNKPSYTQQNNHSINSHEKLTPKKSTENTKVKNTNVKVDIKNNKSMSYESSPFPKRAEKHRIIKLEPVDSITSTHIKNSHNSNSMLDSKAYNNNLSDSQDNFIDPRLINDKIPPSVQKLLDNPILLSSTESLLSDNNPKSVGNKNTSQKYKENKLNSDNEDSTTPTIDDLSAQYDKIMISLEQSMNSQISLQDEDALYNELERLMSSFDDKPSNINNIGSSVKNNNNNTKSNIKDSLDGLSQVKKNNNIESKQREVPYNKSISLNFSSVLNNPLPNPVYPIYTRSQSMLDNQNQDNRKQSIKNNDQYKDTESQLENDIMKSLKDIDYMCDNKVPSHSKYNEENVTQSKKKNASYKYKHEGSPSPVNNRFKQNEAERRNPSRDQSPQHNYTKYIGDSAYGRNSLNRTSPSSNHVFRRSPSHKAASPSSPVGKNPSTGDGGSSRHSPMRDRDYVSPFNKDIEDMWADGRLSSSESDASLSNMTHSLSRTCSSIISTTRMSKFCHDCGSKFPFETAKFCIECGARRLVV